MVTSYLDPSPAWPVKHWQTWSWIVLVVDKWAIEGRSWGTCVSWFHFKLHSQKLTQLPPWLAVERMIENSQQAGVGNPLQSAFTTQHRQSSFFVLGRMACTSETLLGCVQILLEEIAVGRRLPASLEDEGDLEQSIRLRRSPLFCASGWLLMNIKWMFPVCAVTVMRKADKLFKLLLFVELRESKLWETYWGCLWISPPALGSGGVTSPMLCELSQRLPVLPPSQGSLVWGKFFVPSSSSLAFSLPALPYCLFFSDTGNQTQGFTHARQELYHWAFSQPESTCSVTKGKAHARGSGGEGISGWGTLVLSQEEDTWCSVHFWAGHSVSGEKAPIFG